MAPLRKAAATAAGAALAFLRTPVWAGAGALLVAVAVVALTVALLGGDPRRALAALYAGSLGSPSSLVESVIKSVPLIFTGLGVAVAFRCGVWNIGAEGQFLVGMLGSAAAALALPPLPPLVGVPLCLLAGAAAGAAWALPPVLLRLRREVPEVISTLLLNFLAVYLIEYLVRGPMRDPRSASDWSPALPEWSLLPHFSALAGQSAAAATGVAAGAPWALGRLHLGALVAAAAVPAVWVLFSRTVLGFRIRAVGGGPEAARTAGIPVGRTLTAAFLTSGLLAGLGGAVEILGLIQRLYRYEPGSPGYGFSGIAVALLGQLHPAGTLAAALFFGALTAGSNQMQRAAGVSFHVAYVIQAALVLLLLCLPGAPGALRAAPGTGKRPQLLKLPAAPESDKPGTGERNPGSTC